MLLHCHSLRRFPTALSQAHEGGLERTARRYMDSVSRDKTLSLDKSMFSSDMQERALPPMRLISTGDVTLCSRCRSLNRRLFVL